MTALLSPSAKQLFLDNAGNPAASYRLYTYAANTTTPQATYTNRAGTVANTNPIVLDARGEATIYLTAGAVYDYVLQTPQGATVWTREDVIAHAGDAGAVGFTQSYSGSRAQTVSERLRALPLNITDFALLDGVSAPDATGVGDATLAVQRAFDACPDGGTVWINGKFRCTSPITVADKIITIQGFGHQSSQLIFTNCDGIKYSTTEQFTDTIVIAGVGIIADSRNAYTGLRVTLPENVGSPLKNLLLRDVVFLGSGALYSKGWDTAAILNNCAASSAENCLVIGADGAPGDGFLLTGYTVDFVFESPKFYACDRCIKKTGPAEGTIVNTPVAVNVHRLLSLNEGAVSQAGVYAEVNGGHVNYYDIGIYANFHPQVKVRGTLFYSQGASAIADVWLSSCDYSVIEGNIALVKDAAATVVFAKIDGTSTGVLTTNNNVAERSTGVEWGASTVNCIAKANKFGTTNRFSDAGTGNVYEGITRVASGTATLVGGAVSETFAITVPAGIFAAAPRFVDVVGVTFNASFRYNPASSSATSLSVTIWTIDGALLPAGAYEYRALAQE